MDTVRVKTEWERYQVEMPDTLDLVERAELALNGLGGTLDPERDYEMYFFVRFRANPPYMLHMGYDPENEPKYLESFPMMRTMSGTDTYLEAEQGLMAAALRRLSVEDGLYYSVAAPNRPWHSLGHPGYDDVAEDFAPVYGNGRMLRAMLVWYERDGDVEWEDRIRAMVRGLDRIAVHRDDYAYYPDGGFASAFSYPRSGWRHTKEPMDEHEGGEGSVVAYHGHQILGLARWAALSGDEQALDLARELTNFAMLPRFWKVNPEPRGIAGDEKGRFDSHFHARAVALRGILEYAVVANDLRMKEFVRDSYEYGRSLGMAAIGWYPSPDGQFCEGCTLGDMAALGIRLSDAGMGDYWDDIDRLARNQLVEGQLVDAELLEEVAKSGPQRPAGSQWIVGNSGEYRPMVIYTGQDVSENVINRALGNYAGLSTPTTLPDTWVMQCCTGNGTQGLYYAWEGTVRYRDGQAQVNLLLNRASQWLDIDSYLPYEGKVVVHNKTAERIAVRIPAWVNRTEIRARVNDADRCFWWVGNYMQLDGLVPGDCLVVEFPMMERTERYTACSRIFRAEKEYTCVFRGNTLVDISPRDTRSGGYPLYLRDHMRATKAPIKTVARYVAPKLLVRW